MESKGTMSCSHESTTRPYLKQPKFSPPPSRTASKRWISATFNVKELRLNWQRLPDNGSQRFDSAYITRRHDTVQSNSHFINYWCNKHYSITHMLVSVSFDMYFWLQSSPSTGICSIIFLAVFRKISTWCRTLDGGGWGAVGLSLGLYLHKKHTKKCADTDMPRVGFEPTIPVIEWPVTKPSLCRFNVGKVSSNNKDLEQFIIANTLLTENILNVKTHLRDLNRYYNGS
jgi:hypothetical protein